MRLHGILNANKHIIIHLTRKGFIQTRNTGRVGSAWGAHGNEMSFNQFNPLIFTQNAIGNHLLHVLDGKEALLQLHRHGCHDTPEPF